MMRPFKSVENFRPGKSVFDLSYSKLLSADMGLLYPVMCEEMVPGDSFKIGAQIVARVMPLVAPIIHEINIFVHYFFVPNRIVWDDWEDFISGGVLGTDATALPRMPSPGTTAFDAGNTLWDYLGFPRATATTATNTRPVDFPRRAYSLIWDEYYRDETLQTAIGTSYSDTLLRRNWTKDYFTSALPWAQRGTSPALPVTLSGTADVDTTLTDNVVNFDFHQMPTGTSFNHETGLATNPTSAPYPVGVDDVNIAAVNGFWNDDFATVPNAATGTADLTTGVATSFDVNDLRLAFQIQKWMERNARSGVRYTEFLRAHFGVAPRDDRLQRPEYVGGMKAPVIISEVLQTSESTEDHPQGNLAGHGISVAAQYCGRYFATEYGVIMGIMSIMPKPVYAQGVNRQWLKKTRYDYYFPEFAHLGEQAITQGEIYWTDDDTENDTEFGFQGRFDEMRYKPNMCVGQLRPGADFDYWTLTRSFDSAPDLNSDFIECDPTNTAWAVQDGAPQFIINFGNSIKAVRPIPVMGTPGLIDHQ